MIFGAHIGISGGLARAPEEARRIGCDAMQIFSKNQQQWSARPLEEEVARAFRAAVREQKIRATAVHASYLINLGSPKPELWKRSQEALVDELQRAELLAIPSLVLHPGAHTGTGVAAGIPRVAEGARAALEQSGTRHVRLLLETAAGQGSTLGATFEELRELLDRIGRPGRTGICVDTCHVFAAGWDLTTPEGYGRFRDRLDATLGRTEVRLFHLNDAKSKLGSHVDRHANIGEGEIGLAGFRRVVTDPLFADVPGVLETPLGNDPKDPYAAYEKDLRTLRSLLKPS